MATDLKVVLEDRPGALAEAGEALGKAGVNIDGMCGLTVEDKGVLHFLVADGTAARSALEASGVSVSAEREVLVVDVEDQPGTLGKIARSLASAGVNIQLAYLATGTRIVLGVDDLDKAKAALNQ